MVIETNWSKMTSRCIMMYISWFIMKYQYRSFRDYIMKSYHEKSWQTVSITISIFHNKSRSIRMWKIQMREVVLTRWKVALLYCIFPCHNDCINWQSPKRLNGDANNSLDRYHEEDCHVMIIKWKPTGVFQYLTSYIPTSYKIFYCTIIP